MEGSFTFMREKYPQIIPWVDSLQNHHALRDTFIISPDGIRMHAFYARAMKPTSHTAIIVHGYTDNAIRMFHIGYLYNHSLNYNILLPDLRYTGLSEGDAIQMGWLDRKDVMQWIDIAPALFGDSLQAVVHGISMGAATTMMLSGEKLPAYIRCFVEDCGYTSVWDQFQKELKEQFGLPAFPLLYTASWLCEWQNGWNFKEASAVKQVAKCQKPMFFIHGDKDNFVPTYMVHKVYSTIFYFENLAQGNVAKHNGMVLQQYIIHIGKEVEVLGKDGKKWTGVLTDANEENFTITVQVKVKPEGAKRPKLVEQNVTFVYDEIKYTKYLISFK